MSTEAGQLQSAMTEGATLAEGFSYDATGNRLSRTTTSTVNYTYPSDSHRLAKVGGQKRVYDAAGNSTTIHSKHFTYDDYGRMRQFINGTTLRNQYLYNGRGERIAKLNITSPGSTAYYVYDEAGRLLGEYKSTGVAIKEYVWLDDRPVAVIGGYQGHRFQYVLTDHLGTPRAVVNPPTNAIIWRWDLTGSAFGNHARQANPDGDGANYALNLRYPGQYYDGESGLHYNYFRDYDPATGRYVQSDPIGLGGGVNTYSYVGGQPLSKFDPLGLAEWHGSLTFVRSLKFFPRTWVPIGYVNNATFDLHSTCYEREVGILNPWLKHEWLTPGVVVKDVRFLEFDALGGLRINQIVLDDGMKGAPNVANLAGRVSVSMTLKNGVVSGSVTVGRARGTLRGTYAGLVPDGEYEFSGEGKFAANSAVPDSPCGCSGSH